MIVRPRFRFFHKKFKSKNFRILDIGAGSHSPSLTKKVFPNCEYHGVDMVDYKNSPDDIKMMDRYFKMDVTELKFDEIPNEYYDIIMLSHVIEHLHNGDKVIEGLIAKLKKGGYIYVEYPGEKSTRLPKMRDSLNFYDDDTHIRVYSFKEIAELLSKNGFTVISQGIRRYLPYIVFMPVILVIKFLRKGYVPGSVFWDTHGFAEFVYAQKGA